MEDLIGLHPDVKSALVVGQARFQTALLVEAREPSSYQAWKVGFADRLWPVVQEANAQCDTHTRISRDLILLTLPDKPFQRAGKGTVQRRMTVESYSEEIQKVYNDFERLAKPEAPLALNFQTSSIEQSLGAWLQVYFTR